ncbi:MAG: BTAD domain-containing putative transcriptional regulator, partial [Anaerolineae bacterium]
MLKVRLLGKFDVQIGSDFVRIPSRPAQSLFAYLVLTAGTAHRREKLAGLFWPDSAESNARSNLRHALWRLRKALAEGGDYFLTDDLTIAFDANADYWLDSAILDDSVSEDPPLDKLLDAVEVYKGELLPGFYDEWTVLERERLQALFEYKMGLLGGRLVRAGRWPNVLEWGERWIALGQVPEPAYRALMVAHARLGDLSSMAAVYQRCVEALRRELGVEPSEQTQALFEQLAAGELPAPGPSPSPEPWSSEVEDKKPDSGEPPFKGLQYFDVADAGLFFGRERLTARMVTHLHASRFLAVVGASGSGKSSAVRAGLIPALKRGELLADAGGSSPSAGHEGWLVHIITPSAHPLEALAVALTHDEASATAATTLMDDLVRDPRSLNLYMRRKLAEAQRPLLLVVDHFEELFTLCRSEAERQAFVGNLLTAACPPLPNVQEPECEGTEQIAIAVALRADFYAHCGQYTGLREALEQHQVFVGPMNTRELRQAMEEPAQRGGWTFEAGLVDLLLQEVGDEPGALPLLSHALLETWHRRRGRTMTLGGYHESGGVRGAIAQTANRVFGELSPEEQVIARAVFLRLTELGEGTQDTRRRTELPELVSDSANASQVEAVLHKLAAVRLVTIGDGLVEVAHEALIREWPTLRNWLNEDRAVLRLQRHLSETARAWERRGRDAGELYRGARLVQVSEWAGSHAEALNPLEREFLEASQERLQQLAAEREAQRQRELAAAQRLAETEKRRAEEQARASRRLRWLAAGLGLLLLVALVSAFLALQQARRAEQQTRLATSRELAAAAVAQLDVDPERSILLALEAVDATYATEGKVLLEAANALHWAIPASRVRLTMAGHEAQVWGLAYSHDGARLATGSHDGTAKVWDAHSGQEVLSLDAHAMPIQAVALSPDGTELATGSLDGTAKTWDSTTGEGLFILAEGTGGVRDVAFSPEGTRLATTHEDGTAKVWDMVSGKRLLTMRGHSGWVSGVAYSPDGDHLATAGADSTVQVWDAQTG